VTTANQYFHLAGICDEGFSAVVTKKKEKEKKKEKKTKKKKEKKRKKKEKN